MTEALTAIWISTLAIYGLSFDLIKFEMPEVWR